MTVCNARTAPSKPESRVRGYGGGLWNCEPSTTAGEAVFADGSCRNGAEFRTSYNDLRVIRAKPPVRASLMEQVDVIEGIVAPIGGRCV